MLVILTLFTGIVAIAFQIKICNLKEKKINSSSTLLKVLLNL